MYEIPLFPLNTVLFPGMPLPLHIFEDRYKEMVSDCLNSGQPFGVVLVEEGETGGDPLARPHMIGCTAEIAQVQPLDGGRMLILTVGRERFRIVRFDYGKPYLVGVVEDAPLLDETEASLLEVTAELEPLVEEYLEILARAGSVEYEGDQLPEESLELIYLAATLIQLDAGEKQELLDADRASNLAHKLTRLYRRELELLRWLPVEDIGIFSLN